jgi:hypothetical protein
VSAPVQEIKSVTSSSKAVEAWSHAGTACLLGMVESARASSIRSKVSSPLRDPPFVPGVFGGAGGCRGRAQRNRTVDLTGPGCPTRDGSCWSMWIAASSGSSCAAGGRCCSPRTSGCRWGPGEGRRGLDVQGFARRRRSATTSAESPPSHPRGTGALSALKSIIDHCAAVVGRGLSWMGTSSAIWMRPG